MLTSLQNLFRGPAALAERTPVAPPAVPAHTAAPSASFGEVLDHFVSDVNGTMNAAAADQSHLLKGESTNLHQAMISMQEANVAFSLMVEVRNKLVDGYQELMRMQI